MNAYITSIGETTTDLCGWALKRQGFNPIVVSEHNNSQTTLWEKLEIIFDEATDDFLRVDADVIVNQNVLGLVQQKDLWWYQTLVYEWFRQDVGHGGIQFIRKEAFSAIKQHIKEAERHDRPETYLTRLEELHNPRMFGTFEKICGIHGFKQNDVDRVKQVKLRRNQYGDYDWELAERLDSL